MPTFAEWLQSERKKRNLSQHELANVLGMSPRSVSRMERGEGPPNKGNLGRIAELLGEEPARLLAMIDGRPLPERTGTGERSVIEVSPQVAQRIGDLAAEASMSPGEWLERFVAWMEHMTLAELLNSAMTGDPPTRTAVIGSGRSVIAISRPRGERPLTRQ